MRRLGLVLVVAGGVLGATLSSAIAGFTVGDGWFLRQDFENAVRYFSSIIHSDDISKKDLGSAYFNRANAFYELGNFDLALKDYSRALSLDPYDADAYYNRGNTYSDLGDLDHAVSDYTAAIRLQPDHDFAYFNRGNCYLRQGDLGQAVEDYKKAYALRPDDPIYQDILKELEVLDQVPAK